MNAMVPHRGGAPVGYVSELGPVEAGAVRCLRLWCDGPEALSQASREFTLLLGPSEAQKVVKSFKMLCDLCARHGRRPLVRHHVNCSCLGADESWFANFVGYASEGEREDAMLLASTIVRPDMAPALVCLAQDFGLALHRMALKCAGHGPLH